MKDKANVETTHKRINHVRMYKQAWLPFELIGYNGRRRTRCFTIYDEKIPIDWWFTQRNVTKPDATCFKVWCNFLEWVVNERVDRKYETDEKMQWKWKIIKTKEYMRYHDNRLVKMYRKKLTNSRIHQEIEELEVECEIGVLCEYVKDSRVKFIH